MRFTGILCINQHGFIGNLLKCETENEIEKHFQFHTLIKYKKEENMAKVTIENGNKTITMMDTGTTKEWSSANAARVYYDLKFDDKRALLSALYRVISGGTGRDRVVVVNGVTWGYQPSVDAGNSATKREKLEAGLIDFIKQLDV